MRSIPLADNKDRQDSELRKVVLGSSLGTAFEWYDFFIFATLATTMGPLFFSKSLGETATFLASIATYGAGLILRPFGSLLFGRMGDLIGRKKTLMLTMSLMGVSTASIGLLPTYDMAGIAAPIMLVTLRCIQGLALGGEYGGAATYVAEHAETGQRGYATSWIQICATLGFLLSLMVVLLCQTTLSDAQFKTWGWRIPFLISILLFGVSLYVRARLSESPIFLEMKAGGKLSATPVSDSYLNWSNLKLMLSSLFGAVAGVGIIWYTGQFYALFFLTKTLKVDTSLAYILIGIALTLAIPCYLLAGKLSDRFGRKRIMMLAFILAIFTYIPIFKALTHYANPALEQAIMTSPVTIISDQCAVPIFSAPASACQKLRDFLNASGIPHTLQIESANTSQLQIGTRLIDASDLEKIKAALTAAHYPTKADVTAINKPMVVLLLFILVFYVCLAYAPIAAYLVELFPTRIRYSSISMPYHIGTGYFGGFMLYFSTLISTSTGDIYSGLYYPIAIALMSLVVGAYLLPETKDREINF